MDVHLVDLRELAGSASFDRALDYLNAVDDLEIGPDWATAIVYGGADYEVTLETDAGGELTGECDCPYGIEGNFCKHCVAVGLVVLKRQRTSSASQTQAGAAALGDSGDVRERIIALLDTRRFGPYGYVDDRDVLRYASQTGEAVTALQELVDSGQAAQAVTLAREAIRLLCDEYPQIDDESGKVADVLADLEALHREACATADADPVELADWLVGYLLHGTSSAIGTKPGAYRELLGETGWARLRQTAGEALRRTPSGWAERQLVEDLTRAEGDLDALIALLASDLRGAGIRH